MKKRFFFEFLMPRTLSLDCEVCLISTVNGMEIASRPGTWLTLEGPFTPASAF